MQEAQEQKKKISKAVAPLFMSDPFKKKTKQNLWSTHPSMKRRISALERM